MTRTAPPSTRSSSSIRDATSRRTISTAGFARRGLDRPAALHPGDREGQLRDDRPAERRRIAVAAGVRLDAGRVSGRADQGGRRDRARQVEHGGVRVQPVRDGELDPAGLHDAIRTRSTASPPDRAAAPPPRSPRTSARSASAPTPATRSAALVAPGARRHPFDDGADQPRRRRSAQPAAPTSPVRWRARVADAVAVFQVDRGRRPRTIRSTAASARTRDPELRRVARARRPQGRAHRRPAPGLRARHDRSGSRAGVSWRRSTDLQRAGATIVDPVRRRSISTRSPTRRAAGACGGFKYDINALPRRAQEIACRCTTSRRSSSRGAFHPSIEARLKRRKQEPANGPDTPACKAEARLSRQRSRGGRCKTMDAIEAGRARLSDVEQPAAAHRRSQYAARRQQPGVLADHRLAGDHRADGLHARRALPAG